MYDANKVFLKKTCKDALRAAYDNYQIAYFTLIYKILQQPIIQFDVYITLVFGLRSLLKIYARD